MGWLVIIGNFFKGIATWVSENPKAVRIVLEIAAFIWIVICCMTHCGQGRGGYIETSDTIVEIQIVEKWDSSWHSMLGDTIAYYEAKLKDPMFEAPQADFSEAADCRDSLEVVITTLDYCDEVLTKCDEQYRLDYSDRSYGDTIRNDTLEFRYNIDVRGKLRKPPTFDYKLLIPERTVTKTVTITNTIGPRRTIYIGGGVGPVFDTGGPDFKAMNFSFRAGYGDKKNNEFGVRPSYMTLNLWAVEVEYTRTFGFGK